MGTVAPRWLYTGAAAVGGALVGASSMYWWHRGEPASAPPASYSQAAPTIDAEARELELRRVLREELAALASASPVPEQEVPPAPHGTGSASVLSPQSVVHVERANAVLNAAISRLVWTSVDASDFGNAMASLPPAERLALLQKFASAVNEQGMRLETAGPPL